MTREEAKRRAELYSALANGKTIQYKADHGEWTDLKTDLMCGIAESFRYRIKPKYRPFKTQEECWNEMLKHQPFGWIKNNEGNIFNIIAMINRNYTIKLNECYSKYSELFKNFKFTDGTPFGIKETK